MGRQRAQWEPGLPASVAVAVDAVEEHRRKPVERRHANLASAKGWQRLSNEGALSVEAAWPQHVNDDERLAAKRQHQHADANAAEQGPPAAPPPPAADDELDEQLDQSVRGARRREWKVDVAGQQWGNGGQSAELYAGTSRINRLGRPTFDPCSAAPLIAV